MSGNGSSVKGVARHHLAISVTLDQQIGGRHSIGARIVVLTEYLDGGLFVVGADPVLCLRQHAAGTTGRVANGNDYAFLGKYLSIGLQQQVDH